MIPKELIDAAWAARENAYAPYSKYRVGAAIMTENGRIFTGCNVENISFGLTICAERSAVLHAITYGDRKLSSIVVVGKIKTIKDSKWNIPTVSGPCGACRQFLAEFNPKMLVRVEEVIDSGDEVSTQILDDTLDNLLPKAFLPGAF